MYTNKPWLVLAVTLTAGCAMDSDEPLDPSEEEALDEEENLGVAEQEIQDGVGVYRCATTEVSVNGAQGGGNRISVRQVSNGNEVYGYAIACSTMGVAYRNSQYIYEVVANAGLTNFSKGRPSCGTCLQYQGPNGAAPPGGSPPAMYSMMIAFPTTIMSLGVRNAAPGGAYYFGNNAFLAGIAPTSWCDNSAPTFGRLTNAWGFELVNNGGSSDWGTKQYQMWDPTTSTTRAASVNAAGILAYIPWFDACG